jgi:UMF1 family MFS transporter
MNIEKKELLSWYLYDFANSVFSTTVLSVFLGPYFTEIAERSADLAGKISILGLFNIASGSFYPLIVSISVFLQVIILPFFSSIADNTRYKKHILFISAYIGAFATLLLFFVSGNNYGLGAILFIIANIGFGLSCSIYNSYLNHISTAENATRISSIGWATGYLGGGILLILNLFLYKNAEMFNISKEMSIRICISSAGLWWAIFSLIPLKYLRQINRPTARHIFTSSIKGLANTLKDARKSPKTLRFLLSYTLYNDGVQSVIVLAAQFGSAELDLKMDTLILCILFVQFIAFFGALLFNIIAKHLGNLLTLKLVLIIWIGTIIFAYCFLYTALDFHIMCCIVGLIMGGTQAISRSIYSQLIPSNKEAEYFSVYELSEKGTSWFGPFIFAIVYNITISYRLAILSLIVFFVLGFILLLKNKK